MKKLDSKLKHVNDILLNTSDTYYIPNFQRSFVWGKNEIEKMISDFEEDTDYYTKKDSELEGYLLGNIVLIDDTKENRKIVVDGQQRLTTLSLISKAIEEYLNQKIGNIEPTKLKKYYRMLGDIPKGYAVFNEQDKIEKLRINHDKDLGFGEFYEKLLRDEKNNEAKSEQDTKLEIIYNEVFGYLEGLNDEQLENFIYFFRYNLFLNVTIAPNEAKAFQYFEILNARGVSLEQTDLIKNLFLKKISKDDDRIKKNFNNNWKEFTKNLNINKKRKLSASVFLKQYIIAFEAENIKTEKLFDHFLKKSNQMKSDEIVLFSEKVKEISEEYKKIEKHDFSSFDDDINLWILFKLLNVRQFHPLLMHFYKADQYKKAEIIDLVVRLSAAIIFSFTQTNYIEKNLPYIISVYTGEKGNEKNFEDLKRELLNFIDIKSKEMLIILPSKNFVNTTGTVNAKAEMILKFIELYLNENITIKQPKRGKKITVEHILAQQIKEEADVLGFESDTEKDDYIHKLGNLTLLYNDQNSSLGNKGYSEKQETYRTCGFIVTSSLVEEQKTTIINGKETKKISRINELQPQYGDELDHWKKENIIQRGEDISKLLREILLNGK